MALQEYGFWVYVGPQTGGVEGYRERDWDILLDDMAAGGMNSLAVAIRWRTTGYRSKLAYLDQDPAHTIIASDNAILHHVIREAHRRQIKVWFQASLNAVQTQPYGVPLPEGVAGPRDFFFYDWDTPVVADRAAEIAAEIVTLFPEIDGFSAEAEDTFVSYPHRIPFYDAWAKAHGQISYAELRAQQWNPRCYCPALWRTYTTHRNCEVLRQIEHAVRNKGFKGWLNTICETWADVGAFNMAVDLDVFRKEAPDWIAVTYEYNRWRRRLSCADVCMLYPKEMGLTLYFLGRGVMTYGAEKLPIPFADHWRLDFADALQYGIDGLWMFEADACTDGFHVRKDLLRLNGFATPAEARRKLLQIGREMGVPDRIVSQRDK